MPSALFLASGDLNPSVLGVLLTEVSGLPGFGPLTPPLCLSSARSLNVSPLSVRSLVSGRIAPVPVLVTGSTLATLLVTGSMTRLLTRTLFFTNAVLSTTTTVVKLWQM
jgi:hypothetical protein